SRRGGELRHRGVGVILVHRKVPRLDNEEQAGRDVVTAALDEGPGALDGDSRPIETEAGCRRYGLTGLSLWSTSMRLQYVIAWAVLLAGNAISAAQTAVPKDLQPRLFTLDKEEVTVAQALEQLAEQTGNRVV